LSDDTKKKVLAQDSQEEEGRELHLGRGRTLRTGSQGTDDVVEIRAASGQLELRVVLTEAGPVLQLEGVRVQMKAAEAVEIDCKTLQVHTTEGMKLTTDGELDITSEKDTRITSPSEVFVKGKMIWLN
jgi:phage gp45-like